MKERYLSKTPIIKFVYLSKCNMILPCIFWKFLMKVFMNLSSIHLYKDFEGYVVFVVVLCGPIPSGGEGVLPIGSKIQFFPQIPFDPK